MKYIACNVNLFTMNHTIYVKDDITGDGKQVAVCDFDHLPQTIVAACVQEQTNEVKLYGSKKFANGIAASVIELAKTNYSNFDLMIEVI